MKRDLRGVLDAVLAGIVVVDEQARVELMNAAACRMLETSSESAAGRSVAQLFGTAHTLVPLLAGVLASGRDAIVSELSLPRRFEDALVVEASISPLHVESGEKSGAVIVLRDRTFQRALEEANVQRERLAGFAQIAAGIAHEVKNPLGGIRGAAEILGLRSQDAKSTQAAGLIVREVDRIASLVDELMVFTQGGDLREQSVNIHRVLDAVLDLASHDRLASGTEIERRFDPSIPEFAADPDRLTQVFLNLARNALQALAGRSGRLLIETRMPLDQRLIGDKGQRLPTLVVTLADNGPGIPEAVLARLGTPFFTTRAGGTGLGLAVARHWVSRHGGMLQIESEEGRGTQVRVSLPVRRTEA
jgi:two-component system nitrogen regulation sensor histidine kinase GlnL